MKNKDAITGVILAGGLARRMGHQDKGLILFQGQPLVSYAIAAMRPVVTELLINANRNIEAYQQFGWPVISDLTDSFGRMEEHLGANQVDLSKTPLMLGEVLKLNPKTERFTNSRAANRLLTRKYRPPFVVPEKV